MKFRTFAITISAAAIGFSASFTGAVAQQNYPTKSINMVIPFAAGGGADTTGRVLADELSKALGQPVIADNRPGANGVIGSAIVAKAEPDGHTILMTSSSTYALNPNLMKSMPYDQVRDLSALVTVGYTPWILVVSPKSEFHSVADVVNYGKANPGKLTFGFWQSSTLVTGEMFGKFAGIPLRKVPYKGATEAIADLLGERINLLFIDMGTGQGHINSGAMRPLAVTAPQRASHFPSVPTFAEAGYPQVDTGSTNVVFVPSKTPREIKQKLNTELNKVIQKPEVLARLTRQSMGSTIRTLDQADDFVRAEIARWDGMIRSAGIEKE
jgi:tripartite-type tricarboxylate transporter receptor subunit TctC